MTETHFVMLSFHLTKQEIYFVTCKNTRTLIENLFAVLQSSPSEKENHSANCKITITISRYQSENMQLSVTTTGYHL